MRNVAGCGHSIACWCYAKDIGLLEAGQAEDLDARVVEIRRRLTGLSRALRRSAAGQNAKRGASTQ